MTSPVVLITGASSGIGRATARLFAEKGYRVFGTSRRPDATAAIPDVEFVALDVRDQASVKACTAQVLERAGRIDVLVNNAGFAMMGAVEETSPDEAQALFDTNVLGMLRMVRAVLPTMREQGSGPIVNTSSVLGFLPAPFMGAYASSKHAVEGLSESLDHEVRGFGIRVVLVQPNFTRTELGENAVSIATSIEAYGLLKQRVSVAIGKAMKVAPGPETVAAEILRAAEESYQMRRPVGSGAKLLSRLRRSMPAGPVDRGLRKTFALS
jgi:NAD(P)-dependent dehydrogenase (short-subunit alcohol dehydrogenase family)